MVSYAEVGVSVDKHRSLRCAFVAVGAAAASAILVVCYVFRYRQHTEVAEVPACADVAALVSRPRDAATEASLLVDNAAKNEIANAMLSGESVPEGLVASLCRMAEDSSYDECWRDYCLQFLGVALSRRDGALSVDDRLRAMAVLRRASCDSRSTSAGTAILSLRSAAEASGDARLTGEAAELPLRVAMSDNFPDGARTTALLVLEQSGHPQTQRVAAHIARSRPSSLLRETALAVASRTWR